MRSWTVSLALLFFGAAAAIGFEGPSADIGRILYDSPKLGSSGNSCSSCHPVSRGLKNIVRLNDASLKTAINACLQSALLGRLMDGESTEMNSLLLYLRSRQEN
ncbi:cytochrome C [uncultured Desulfuromonas sp.]|uniref:cytochrome C n=1 Tax=uncultured Desulfuromonas sp. TaxID=181013 RepID=UPI00261C9333|nr:cytochrome C [uncultured Desulfuromonas sp.]